MLDLKKMKNKLINDNLLGSWCEEFYYAYDSRELRLEKAGYLVGSNPDNRITSITPPEFEHNFNPKSDFAISSGINLKYAVGVKVADNKIYEATNTDVFISDDTRHYKCIPFTEYKKKSILIDPIKDNLKKDCRVLNFSITTETYSAENKYTYNKYEYRLSFEVAINQECYIYIIQTPDVNPPTILVCKERIGEFDLNDINKYIFKGNVEDGIYNSYFHPHEYNIQKNTNYSNLVFGSPDCKLNKIKFKEDIEYLADGNGESVDRYTTNDGLKAINIDGKVDVYLEDYKIGSYYTQVDVDFDNIDLCKYKSDKGLFNSLITVIDTFSINEIKNMYPNLQYIIPEIPVSHDEKRIQHINTDDDFVVLIFEDYQDDFLELVLRISKDGTSEMMYTVNGNEKVYYSIYRNNKRLDIFTTVDENNNHVYYSSTLNRSINYSRDIALISYKENFYISLDKANIVVNSNLPIVGEEFTRYNIFGVPEKF